MGERTKLRPGDRAPNDGVYMEVGEDNDPVMGINDPKRVKLNKGDRLPETTNGDRRWVLTRNRHPR